MSLSKSYSATSPGLFGPPFGAGLRPRLNPRPQVSRHPPHALPPDRCATGGLPPREIGSQSGDLRSGSCGSPQLRHNAERETYGRPMCGVRDPRTTFRSRFGAGLRPRRNPRPQVCPHPAQVLQRRRPTGAASETCAQQTCDQEREKPEADQGTSGHGLVGGHNSGAMRRGRPTVGSVCGVTDPRTT